MTPFKLINGALCDFGVLAAFLVMISLLLYNSMPIGYSTSTTLNTEAKTSAETLVSKLPINTAPYPRRIRSSTGHIQEEYDLQLAISQKNMIFNWPHPRRILSSTEHIPEEYDFKLAISQKNMIFNCPYPRRI